MDQLYLVIRQTEHVEFVEQDRTTKTEIFEYNQQAFKSYEDATDCVRRLFEAAKRRYEAGDFKFVTYEICDNEKRIMMKDWIETWYIEVIDVH